MIARRLITTAAASACLALGACGDEPAGSGGEETPAASQEQGGGGALGGGAQTATLASLEDVERAPGRTAWSGWRVELEPGEVVEHRHGTSTVLAEEGEHRLDGDVLTAGDGAAVRAGKRHRHAAPEGSGSVFSEFVLAEPGFRLPDASGARRLFESEVLEGVPEAASLRFIEVRLPPGSETSAHTHPGPEFIYGTQGRFDYENAIEGERRFGPGDTAGIPPDTAVQKRNPSGEEAVFLSWFLVDPEEPFAPGASFESGS